MAIESRSRAAWSERSRMKTRGEGRYLPSLYILHRHDGRLLLCDGLGMPKGMPEGDDQIHKHLRRRFASYTNGRDRAPIWC